MNKISENNPYLYRTKLVYIEAWHWTFSPHQLKAPEWMESALTKWPNMGGAAFWPDGNHDVASDWRDKPHIAINTLEGTMIASPGDFIIQGLQGEIYPCKPEIFAKKYEQAAVLTAAAPQTPSLSLSRPS